MDVTYKLLELRMPVYLMLAVDGNGLSEIVALFLLADESKEVIESAVEAFKKYNSSWTQTKVIMSNKERDAFAGCFPDAKLNICLYHTLRTF